MSSTRAPRHTSRTKRKSPRRPAPAPPLPDLPEISVSRTARLPSLPEPPHTHLVCRGCARILEVGMEFDQQQTLEELIRRTPAGWSIDSITVSLTGVCPRCREGPRV